MIAFTLKGVNYLISKGVEKAIVIRKQILAWLKGQDKRFPNYPGLTVADKAEMDPGDARRLTELAARVLKPI